MRVTASLLGWTMDWSLSPDAAEDTDEGAALNGGTLAAYPVGFTHAMAIPEEVVMPQRTPAWDDEE